MKNVLTRRGIYPLSDRLELISNSEFPHWPQRTAKAKGEARLLYISPPDVISQSIRNHQRIIKSVLQVRTLKYLRQYALRI